MESPSRRATTARILQEVNSQYRAGVLSEQLRGRFKERLLGEPLSEVGLRVLLAEVEANEATTEVRESAEEGEGDCFHCTCCVVDSVIDGVVCFVC